jgi:dTDP-glucose pyrophosphorylase
MANIDKSGLQTSFLCSSDNTLMGSLSDGDIRRALLSGATLDDLARKYANLNPIYVNSLEDQWKAFEAMDRLAIKCIPVVINKKIVHVFSRIGRSAKKESAAVALIMAGGRGERLKPLTDVVPKPLVRVAGKPLIEILVERLVSDGVFEIWISVHYLSQQIVEYLGDGTNYGAKINYIYEDSPLGTAGAYLLLPPKIRKDSVIICNADLLNTVSFSELIESHRNSGFLATIGVIEHLTRIPFGVIKIKDGQAVQFTEKPDVHNYISAGIGVFEESAFTPFLANKPLNITDIYSRMIEERKSINVFQINGYWQDLGTRESLKAATSDLDDLNR